MKAVVRNSQSLWRFFTQFCEQTGEDFGKAYTVSIEDKKSRSLEQNQLMWLWMREAADQLKEDTASGYQAYCKLHFGVPILRGEDDDFRKAYDEVIKPLPYEKKLKAMLPPLSLPVTSIMKSGQLKRFLDDVYAHFTEQGCQLTEPEG